MYDNGLASAPRKFKVWSADGDAAPRLLGSGEFDPQQKAIQTFQIISDVPLRTISVQIESNWGNPEWTCIYRIRVTGTE